MRNKATCNDPNAYPITLVTALRIASAWMNEGSGSEVPGSDTHSAFVTADTNIVAKSKDKDTKKSTTTGKVTKKALAEVTCYVYGELGHYARDCKDKKGSDAALVTGKTGGLESEDEIDEEDDDFKTAYVTTSEKVLFSRFDVLLDSQASVNVFCNRRLLRNVREFASSKSVSNQSSCRVSQRLLCLSALSRWLSSFTSSHALERSIKGH